LPVVRARQIREGEETARQREDNIAEIVTVKKFPD